MARPQDAPRRNAGQFFSTLEFEGERVSIWAGWATNNASMKLVTRMASGVVPGPVVGHRAFDAEEFPVAIGDDKEERRQLLGHGISIRPK